MTWTFHIYLPNNRIFNIDIQFRKVYDLKRLLNELRYVNIDSMYNINQIMSSMDVRSYMNTFRFEKDYLAFSHHYFPPECMPLPRENYNIYFSLLSKHLSKIYLNNFFI